MRGRPGKGVAAPPSRTFPPSGGAPARTAAAAAPFAGGACVRPCVSPRAAYLMRVRVRVRQAPVAHAGRAGRARSPGAAHRPARARRRQLAGGGPQVARRSSCAPAPPMLIGAPSVCSAPARRCGGRAGKRASGQAAAAAPNVCVCVRAYCFLGKSS